MPLEPLFTEQKPAAYRAKKFFETFINLLTLTLRQLV